MRGNKSNIAILGAGVSGFSAAKLALKSKWKRVDVFDSRTPEDFSSEIEKYRALGINVRSERESDEFDCEYEVAVISPGVDVRTKLAGKFRSAGVPIIGEIEWAWCHQDAGEVLAITGTNGKTTTTELAAEMLKASGIEAVTAGNIGNAYSGVLCEDEFDVAVVEVSSFQLETIKKFKPNGAIWTNFAADHLDRYDSIVDYKAAKVRVFENQDESDFAVVRYGESVSTSAGITTFSAYQDDADIVLVGSEILFQGKHLFDFRKSRLNGKHNAENLMASAYAALRLGARLDRIQDCIYNFEPIAHRCEEVGIVTGVRFINDSKSTNLHSMASALRGQDGKVVLIAGGKEKGLNYLEIKSVISETVDHMVCLGEVRYRLFEMFKDSVDCSIASDMYEAVQLAVGKAKKGQVVLLSPGTSSFDQYSSYTERGDMFKKIVNSL